MLEMRPACERCAADLPPTSTEALICSFECTWCTSCVTGPLGFICPHCRGALRPRPPRGDGPPTQTGAAPSTTPVVRADDLRRRLPGPTVDGWPAGAPFVVGLEHGSMSVELYVPEDVDAQTPHARDEIYVIERGRATLRIGEAAYAVGPGDVAFVGAGEEHRFEVFEPGFATWVLFWGPIGGER